MGFFASGNVQDHGPGPTIQVQGVAVWMFNQGFHVDKTVNVTGTTSDMLVLCVRGTGVDDSMPALWLGGGINSPNVPVILVSDHRIIIDSQPNGAFPTTLGWLNLYAPSAWIWGPKQQSAQLLTYSHPSWPSAEANLNKLFRDRALPNVTGPRNSSSFVAGSWREVTESNPN
ncbi:MAG: hypothetical protein E6K80_09025 [Candidatus Eisenbacteria bacterium]|uniref:Uncharacterized protein n=1 Tax=Eiseniibacteriota bacterium TaxID=2212470 RepID=A0A538U2Z1_UNCEI|nr:MAG: hypothetical protein E6K80_09025 [Candidatus Eisenbacteria bacterium]